MSMERAKAHLEKKGYLDRVIEPAVQTATVAEAAAARALTGTLAVGLLTLILSPQGGGIMIAAYGQNPRTCRGFLWDKAPAGLWAPALPKAPRAEKDRHKTGMNPTRAGEQER